MTKDHELSQSLLLLDYTMTDLRQKEHYQEQRQYDRIDDHFQMVKVNRSHKDHYLGHPKLHKVLDYSRKMW